MNSTHETVALIELKELLMKILGSEVPELADLRRVEQLRWGIKYADDAAFHPIRAAVSDLDTVPDDSRRQFFSDRFLIEKDDELASYMRAAAPDLRSSASLLLSSEWMRAT